MLRDINKLSVSYRVSVDTFHRQTCDFFLHIHPVGFLEITLGQDLVNKVNDSVIFFIFPVD